MKTHEKIELALIPVVVGAVWLGRRFLPVRLTVGELLVIACLAWLVQGGIRDLWLIWRMKSRPAPPSRRLACMCLESGAGLTGILLGIVLVLCGVGGEWALSAERWALLTAGVLTLGFLLKDFVVTWRPLGLRREPEHHTIIFTWR